VGRNFDVTIGRAACEACSATWDLGIAGPSGCKLASSQQSGIKYVNPNVSPCMAVALF
jgi:hypothetical protein